MKHDDISTPDRALKWHRKIQLLELAVPRGLVPDSTLLFFSFSKLIPVVEGGETSVLSRRIGFAVGTFFFSESGVKPSHSICSRR